MIRCGKAASALLQGRGALTNSPLVAEMDINVSIAKLNLATMKTAKAFGLDDVVVKTTVGVHDGQSGIFMEKAQGVSGGKFALGTSPSSADSTEYSLGDIKNMMKAPVGSEERSKGEKISAELSRASTRKSRNSAAYPIINEYGEMQWEMMKG